MTVTMEMKEYEKIKEKLEVYDELKDLIKKHVKTGSSGTVDRFYEGNEKEAMTKLSNIRWKIDYIESGC